MEQISSYLHHMYKQKNGPLLQWMKTTNEINFFKFDKKEVWPYLNPDGGKKKWLQYSHESSLRNFMCLWLCFVIKFYYRSVVLHGMFSKISHRITVVIFFSLMNFNSWGFQDFRWTKVEECKWMVFGLRPSPNRLYREEEKSIWATRLSLKIFFFL